MNIVQIIREETTSYQNNRAIVDGNRNISYGDLFAAVDKVAILLKEYGIKDAERVGLLYSDSIEYVIINLAVLSIKAVIVPIFSSLSRDEINALAEKMEINFIISEKESEFQNMNSQGLFVCTPEKGFFLYHCTSKKSISEAFRALNPAFIRFSSGTTGVNKGVILSHESIMQRAEAANKGLNITSKDEIIWVLSMSFHFVVTIFLFLRQAATIIICSRAFPETLLDGLKQNKATFMYASPFHYYMLTHTDMFSSDLLSGIRMAVSTASKLPGENAAAFYEKFGFELSQAYGIIEIGLPFINQSQDKSKRSSVGKILSDYEIKLLNTDSEEIGEVWIRGKGMLEAYFSPWKTRKDLLQDNWFNTGDIGKLDKDGFLFLTGRTKNIINFCGMKIFPYEVELVVNQHPAVKESLVYGVPHSSYGQIPCARVVLKEKLNTDFNSRGIKKFCYMHLAPHKVPKEFHLVSYLDKTPSGKLLRK